jgi:hypothetical protein
MSVFKPLESLSSKLLTHVRDQLRKSHQDFPSKKVMLVTFACDESFLTARATFALDATKFSYEFLELKDLARCSELRPYRSVLHECGKNDITVALGLMRNLKRVVVSAFNIPAPQSTNGPFDDIDIDIDLGI